VYINPGQTRIDQPAGDGAVVAGGRTAWRLPVGPTYDRLVLQLFDAGGGRTAAEIAADIARLRISVGGRVKWDVIGADIVYLANYYGTRLEGASPVSPGNNGILPIYLSRPWMRPVAPGEVPFTNEDGPAYGTLGEASFTLEIDWAAASGSTICTVTSLHRAGTPLGSHVTVLPLRRNLAGAGIDIVNNDFPKDGANSAYVAMHIGDASVTEVEFSVERSTFHRLGIDELNHANRVAGRAPDANYAAIDFAARNRFNDCLAETMTDMELRATFGVAPGDYTILLERIEVSEIRPVQRT
jgi:hypothetical protein